MPIDFSRVEAIFSEAVAIAASAERAAFLDRACGEDLELRRRVERLLASYEVAGQFMAGAYLNRTIEPFLPVHEKPGTQIGQYKLLEQIGEGGFGVVFMAEQDHPIRRRVALKIIKLGMDTRQVIARFEAERQALAMMDHPSVAKVFDAGATETGRPYFVMELVRGVPVTEYCDKNKLNIRQRLDLFVQVCQAVQHAHQKGLIHRDLKPSNVLVSTQDERPVAKVIDFGIAKATQARLTEKTLFTEFQQLVGTPQYMSPEQADSSLDIDTRSDIYSLGVLLYELLTGTTPFEPRELCSKAYAEIQRIIREVEPPKPSTKLSRLEALPTVAADRSTEPRKLGASIRGELDWIVMKCLEKDRARRYDSATALAMDLAHHLADEPVTAAAPSRAYRLSKFVRRNRRAVIASAIVAMALIAGAIGSTVGFIAESRRAAIAERERSEAQFDLAISLQARNKYADAEALYRKSLPADTRGPEDQQHAARTLLRLGQTMADQGRVVEAERTYKEAIAAYRRAFPPVDLNIAYALTTLATFFRDEDRFSEAEPLFREALQITRNVVPPDHYQVARSAMLEGNVLSWLGRFSEAEPLLRESIAQQQLEAPPSDPGLLGWVHYELGLALLAQSRMVESESELLEAKRLLQDSSGRFGLDVVIQRFYATWDQIEPGKGHDASARQWQDTAIQENRLLLAVSTAATRPSTRSATHP